MKKYFLLIILMTVVFLGLGNVTMGQFSPCGEEPSILADQEVRDEYNDCIADQQIINEIPTCSCTNGVVSSCPTTILGTGTPGSNCTCSYGGDVISCIDTATSVSELGEGNSCTSPVGSVSNGLRCVCPDAGGIKQIAVDGVCKKCNAEDVCCGIKLNTKVPFIGNCIESKKDYVGGNSETGVTGEEAFPVLMGSLTQILVTVILIVSFLLIVAGGIMIATGDPSGGKKMIIKVVIGIAILGASGVILRLINPNFFG